MYVCVHAFKSFAQVTIFISISIKELFIYIYIIACSFSATVAPI